MMNYCYCFSAFWQVFILVYKQEIPGVPEKEGPKVVPNRVFEDLQDSEN